MFSGNWLFVSLVWGSIGLGYCVYGRRQQSFSAFIGGIVMLLASYFIGSSLAMSVVCLGVAGAVYYLAKQGY